MVDQSADLRRLIQRTFSARGTFLSKESLTFLAQQMVGLSKEVGQKTLARIIMALENEQMGSDLLTLDRLKDVIKTISRNKRAESETYFKLENAFEWRTELKKVGTVAPELGERNSWKNLAFSCMIQRFELVKSLLEEDSTSEFSTIESLFPLSDSRVRLLAMLSRENGNAFSAEDMTGSVRLNLDGQGVKYEPGIYFEGGIFVFEGIYKSGQIFVENIGLPRLKPIAPHNRNTNVTARKDPNDRIVFFSDVNLDDAGTMKALYKVLEGFSTSPPNIFVFCGRFLSEQLAYGYTNAQTNAFRHLANIFLEFSAHYQNTQFILVPSTEDFPYSVVTPSMPVLPTIRDCFNELTNVHFATNPCRLIFKDQTIVIRRDDIVEKLCRTAIHVPEVPAESRADKAATIQRAFCDTIWSQRHLSPLPLHFSPIQSNFDCLLQLGSNSGSLPDVLVVADQFRAFHETASSNRQLTLNPGPFSQSKYEFLVLFPTLCRVESSVYVPEK